MLTTPWAFFLGIFDGTQGNWPRFALHHPNRLAYDTGRRVGTAPVYFALVFTGFCVGLHFGLKLADRLAEKIFG